MTKSGPQASDKKKPATDKAKQHLIRQGERNGHTVGNHKGRAEGKSKGGLPTMAVGDEVESKRSCNGRCETLAAENRNAIFPAPFQDLPDHGPTRETCQQGFVSLQVQDDCHGYQGSNQVDRG